MCWRSPAAPLYRKNRRTLTVGWDEVEPAEAAGDEGGAYVEHLLSFLDSEERQAFTLHVYGDLTFQETAAVLRCPVSTAKSRDQRACDILRKRLEREAAG